MRLSPRARKYILAKNLTATAAMLTVPFLAEAADVSAISVQTSGVAIVQPSEIINLDDEDSTIEVVTTKVPTGEDEPLTPSDKKRFQQLAILRAKKRATAEDNAEFDHLQKRRRLQTVSSVEETLAECSRRRFYAEMMEVLRRNVRFLQPEDQKKLAEIKA